MYGNKVILSLAALSGAALAQDFPASNCNQLIEDLVAAAPTIPASIQTALAGTSQDSGNANDLLVHPDQYVNDICKLAGSLPEEALSDFKTWGPSLLHFASTEISSYDAIVTQCITTGAAAASITSYIHSIASNPGSLCQPTSTPSAGASITAYPTASGNGTVPTGTPTPTSSIPTAGAARPTNLLAGAAAMGGLLGAVALL